jgi:hypothetical protein
MRSIMLKGGRHASPETRQQRDDQDRRVEQQEGVGKTYLNLETGLSRNRNAHGDEGKSMPVRLRSQPPGDDRNRSRSIGRTHGQPSIHGISPGHNCGANAQERARQRATACGRLFGIEHAALSRFGHF